MPKISLQKRRQVINLYKQKWNICRISKELSIISSTVLRIIKKYQTFGTVEDRKRPGRNRKITEKMKKIVVWTAKKDPKIIVPIKNKVDASCYIQILKDHALNFLDLHEIFQQDNAPAHSAEKTRIFFEENAFVCLENWPPQSPDLNIIENLWSVLKKAVSRRNPRNLDELLSFSQEEFAKIPKDYVQKLYDSIPSRLTLVLQNNGYATKY